jgi:hypothetical protein
MAGRERQSSESSSESVNLEDLENEEKVTPVVKSTFNVTFKLVFLIFPQTNTMTG